ncbi:DNA repair protein RecO [Arcanobacterium hippocoleae]|uniref:DNA repair protein RecO n=1 Tax=Arcanobacterium hippocoleae TaxID=149017 RepID=A0ABU1T0M7_9ACTO|nr:DNA repair protein RecO [Arcanobacterium hippocoleae]MDR6938913.1 DNA repair protein RecO (recombination protein O) [Arcanobacterium hippocoleae]
MNNKTYRDQAIVLRTQDLGEADRVITLLTPNHGKIRAVARGVRKTKSRFGARLEPFSYIDLQLYTGRSLDVITQVESINAYHRTIITNYHVYTSAMALLDTIDHLMEQEGEPDLAQFTLLHGAVHAMATGAHLPDLILNSYILRAMRMAGWELAVFECAVCGIVGPHQAMNVALGGAVCDMCKVSGGLTPAIETWQLLGALLVGDWKIADLAALPTRRQASGIISAFLQWHLEHPMKSLRYVHSRLIS